MSDKDEVLSLFGEDSDKSFSGFSDMSDEENGKASSSKGKSKAAKGVSSPVKSKKVKAKPQKKTKSQVQKDKGKQPSQPPFFDLSKLSESDISNLKDVLGIQSQHTDVDLHVDDVHGFSGAPLDTLPNIRVQLDAEDISGDELYNPGIRSNLAPGFADALADGDPGFEEEDEWSVPRLKVPEKGQPVAKSLAKMVNVACTSQCEVGELLNKHKVPENCDRSCPPLVNNEIWKVMDKRTQSMDRALVDIQNLVAAAMSPIMKLADTIKAQNVDARNLIADSLTLLGQIQFSLSVRRRYSIRPVLKKKYHQLCSIARPVTSLLFGDDVSKDIKACDSMQFIGREQSYRGQFPRGRGFGRGRRAYGTYQSQRFQPYPQGQRGQYVRGAGLRNYHIPKRVPTATVTAPNEKM